MQRLVNFLLLINKLYAFYNNEKMIHTAKYISSSWRGSTINHIAKIFINGRSQTVRLPKDFRFDCDEVFVQRQGEDIIISPKKLTWDDFFDQASAFDKEFMSDREQSTPQN